MEVRESTWGNSVKNTSPANIKLHAWAFFGLSILFLAMFIFSFTQNGAKQLGDGKQDIDFIRFYSVFVFVALLICSFLLFNLLKNKKKNRKQYHKPITKKGNA
jgi:hypothetical protein